MKFPNFTKFFCITIFTLFALSANAGPMFSATLGGDQEVPTSASAASGSAMAELTGTAGSYMLTYTIDFIGLSGNPFGGHLHNAPFGSNGGVVHFLDFLPASTFGTIVGDWAFNDTPRPLTDALANELLAGNIYINLHTSAFPGGEIRGQLTRVPEPAAWLLMATGLILLIGRRNLK